MSCSEEPQKSSSEILNELFSTFNSTFPAEPQKKPKKAKKEKKETGERSSKKRKHSSSPDKKLKKKRKGDPSNQIASPSFSPSPPKMKKKKKVVIESPTGRKKKREKVLSKRGGNKSSSGKIPIGDGFVVMNKTEQAQGLEDGEIVEREEDEEKKTKKKSRRRNVEAHEERLEGLAKSAKKLSASQAYKLDAEEKLLLGYDAAGRKLKLKLSSSSSKSPTVRQAPPMRRSPSPVHSRSKERRRSRSTSPSSSQRHRVAPPRDKNTYKSSYLKFQKEHEYDYDGSGRDVGNSRDHRDQSSSSRSYDTASYYDYHASRSRTETSSARSGFGYVGKSYYYDDVVEEERESSSSSSRSKSYGTSAWRHRHRSRSRSKSPARRRSYYHPDDIIDKAELLEIARRNAKRLLQRGVLPSDIFSRDQIVAIKAGGKNVDELTDYCRRLAKRDARGDARSDDSGDEAGGGRFIHHPFVVKDKPLPTITMNIRNAVPLPVRTPQEMAIESTKRRSQFPVSSGTQHRFKEIEWKPVEDGTNKAEAKNDDGEGKALVPIDGVTTAPPSENTPSTTSVSNIATVAPMPRNEVTELLAIEAPPEDTGITLDPPKVPDVDISCVIGLRLKAMRALQENPESGRAKNQLEEATKMMKNWADAKALEPKFLSVAELSSGPQAWAKRDQLRKTKQLDSGMGMHLLQKMGWKPGEGLGKNKEGQLEPLALDVKTDKKGLTAAVEELMFGKSKGGGGGGAGPSMPSVYDLSGKHPVSALMELTAKRRWGAPEFEMCFEHGPPHKRQFVYKVIVNGVEYQPCVAVGNKKQAKANAAAFCLQSLGLLPSAAATLPEPPELLQTVPPALPPPPQPSCSDNNFSSNNTAGLTGGGNAQPLTNPLQQTFSSGRNFLQTVNVGDAHVKPSQISGALMPPPPPPPPLINFLRK